MTEIVGSIPAKANFYFGRFNAYKLSWNLKAQNDVPVDLSSIYVIKFKMSQKDLDCKGNPLSEYIITATDLDVNGNFNISISKDILNTVSPLRKDTLNKDGYWVYGTGEIKIYNTTTELIDTMVSGRVLIQMSYINEEWE